MNEQSVADQPYDPVNAVTKDGVIAASLDMAEYRRRALSGEPDDVGHDGRVFLVCRNCDARITLYRFRGSFAGGTCRVADAEGQVALAAFLVKHDRCWIGEREGRWPQSDVPDLALMVF